MNGLSAGDLEPVMTGTLKRNDFARGYAPTNDVAIEAAIRSNKMPRPVFQVEAKFKKRLQDA